ncbi:MAG: ABC transporter ATP-binding protein [Proteobacteria bacterium]|nr:ABC transporter ATP-binding protein [Pseudomonadota bacterium]
MIELTNIAKIFKSPDGREIKGLDRINLTIGQGEFLSIVGPSGSGKSTLMNILGCLDKPSSGIFLLNGVEVQKMADKELSKLRNKEIGFIFQSYNLLPKLNAIENVELPLVYRKIPPNTRRKEAYAALCQVGLKDRIFYKPSQLSGGQQQRVAVARALVARPSIIFGDELTGALDPKSCVEIMNIIKGWVEYKNITVVLVTHDMKIAKMAKRVIKINNGVIIEDYINN